MKTLGIDLSADVTKSAACLIDWNGCSIELLPRPVSDDALVTAVVGADMTAIDVPLGWPDAFIDALVAHRDGGRWPAAATVPPADREPLRYRLTDLIVRRAGAQPLSVSTDRIGVAAMRGARIQHLLAEAGLPVDRSGTSGRVVETYPAAALRSWGMRSSGYKGAKNAGVAAELLDALAARCGNLATLARTQLRGCDDDDLDALVCSIVARAAILRLTTRPADDEVGIARREGWIHVPNAPVETIVAPSVMPRPRDDDFR